MNGSRAPERVEFVLDFAEPREERQAQSSVDFSVPHGYTVDDESLKRHAEITRAAHRLGIEFAAAAGLFDAGAIAFADSETGAVDFACPSGYGVDSERLSLHRRALLYSAARKVDYLTAVRALAR